MMADLTGRWIGQVRSTNGGTFVLNLEQSGDALRGELILEDVEVRPLLP